MGNKIELFEHKKVLLDHKNVPFGHKGVLFGHKELLFDHKTLRATYYLSIFLKAAHSVPTATTADY